MPSSVHGPATPDPAGIQAREAALTGADDVYERMRLGELAVVRARELGRPLDAALGQQWRIRAAYQLGRLDLVDEALADLRTLADASGLPAVRWHQLRAQASQATLEGDFTCSRTYSAQATLLAQRSGDPVTIGMTYAHAQQLATLRGDVDELPENTLTLIRLAPNEPIMVGAEALALISVGRRAEAYAIYTEFRAVLAHPRLDMHWSAVLLYLTELAVAFADAPTAGRLIEHWLPYERYPGGLGTPTAFVTGSVSRDLGRLNAVRGELAAAEDRLRTALIRNDALRARPHTALTTLDLADVLHRRGRLDEATTAAAEAVRLLRELDMPGPRSVAEQLAARLALAAGTASR